MQPRFLRRGCFYFNIWQHTGCRLLHEKKVLIFFINSDIINGQWSWAGVAKLADARDLKSRGRNTVRVQVPSPAERLTVRGESVFASGG